jgi:hypothetical protein
VKVADHEKRLCGRTSLGSKQISHRILGLTALVLACQLSQAVPAFAEESINPAVEKWRPKDGLYASPGKDFDSQCGEFGDVIVELAEKSISGSEWSCKITRLTDTAPGDIRLDLTCDDYNLALFINEHDPNAYERKFSEIMLLKKINEKTIFVRKTLNGKFKDPRWQASYCPEETQRLYTEAKAKNKAEAEQKAADEQSRPKPGRP